SELEQWQSPKDIRAALTENEIAASDKRVKYVTLRTYEKAGGTVNRDLFSTDDAGIFIADTALLARLVSEKLEKAAVKARSEGWKWVEVHPDLSSRTDDEVLAWVHDHAKPVTAFEKQAWAEQIDRYRPDAALAEYRRRAYPELAARMDVSSLSVLDLIDMDEGRLPLQS
ncbi:MAG: DUF5069 domain-containing protein, partial [Nitrospiraceae bacterium]